MTVKNEVLIILILYMLANLIIGIWVSRKSAKQNAEGGFLTNYFVGGRTMGGVVLAMTLVATYTSASSFLGGPGLAASWGLTQSWVAGVQIGAAFLTLGVLGKKLGLISRRINAVTVSDYLRARYKSPAVVILCSLFLVIFFITQMVAQFIGGATLVSTVTGLPYMAGLTLFGAIVIIYTVVGGFKAVVITDTIQGLIMTIGVFLLLFFVIRAGGGYESILDTLNTNNPDWNLLGWGESGKEIPALRPGYLLSYWVLVGVAVMGLPQTAVRGMGFKDTRSMHSAMLYGTIIVGILMIGMHWIGAFSFPLLPEEGLESTDQVIPFVVLHNMPGWVAGLFLAAPLAAVMSTVDSLLILASATIIKDVYLNYIRKDKAAAAEESGEGTGAGEGDRKVRVWSFVLTAVIGIIVYLFALNPPDIIVWINLFALGGLECTYFWPLIGGLYYKKGNAKACIVSVIAALIAFVFFNHFKDLSPFGMHEVVWGLVVGGIAYFLVSYLSKEEPDEEMLRKCF